MWMHRDVKSLHTSHGCACSHGAWWPWWQVREAHHEGAPNWRAPKWLIEVFLPGMFAGIGGGGKELKTLRHRTPRTPR